MVKKLENPQEKILQYIKSYCEENAYPPSVREICTAVGLNSTSTVHKHLKNLETKGLIVRDPLKQRAITVNNAEDALTASSSTFSIDTINADTVPLVGRVAAGVPILAVENVEDAFPLPSIILRGSQIDEVFMLRVNGNSMSGVGINNGDIIVVNKALDFSDGDIVVALVNGEAATVKRIFRERGRIRLQPENDLFEPIFASYDTVQVAGKVIGLLRTI